LTTVTDAVWALAMSDERIVAFTCDPLTNVVARVLPFHITTPPGTNPVPFMVSVNPGPPGSAAAGTSGWLITGTGFAAHAVPALSRKSMDASRQLKPLTNGRLLSFAIKSSPLAVLLVFGPLPDYATFPEKTGHYSWRRFA
jgi:hypothetical protein